MRILVIDDHARGDFVDKRLLESKFHDWSVDKAVTLSVADTKLKKYAYDAILIEYLSDEKYAEKVLQQLRLKPDLGSTAIVMIGSPANEQTVERWFAAGAQDFILIEELNVERIQRVISQARRNFKNEQQLIIQNNQIKYLAESDSLTGLANRYHFINSIENQIVAEHRRPNRMATLLLNINKFRFVNDDFGHAFGDKVIILLVEKLQKQMRTGQLFARLSGDNFGVLLSNYHSLSEVSHFAKRLIEITEEPFKIGDIEISLTVALGISVYPQDASDSQTLIQHSEIAMYRAKADDDSTICYYEDKMQSEFLHSFRLESAITQYTESEQFNLHYQAIYSSCKSKLLGYEALLRWPQVATHYEPDEFIPIAEKSGLIVPLGKWIIQKAFADLAKMQKRHSQVIHMSINVSPVQLESNDFVEVISSELKRNNIAPQQIVLEITETMLILGKENIQSVLNEISQLGLVIALDDFGTGYSSLSHLMNFPINVVKLDKTLFVLKDGNLEHLSLIKGVVTMLKSLNMKIVAEGVEHDIQQALCEELRLDNIQGFLLGRPLPIEHFA